MSLYEYKGKSPDISENVFIAESSDVIGDVILGKDSSVWHGSVIRGDIETITIGKNSNIQDNSTLHTSEGYPLTIGENVTIEIVS